MSKEGEAGGTHSVQTFIHFRPNAAPCLTAMVEVETTSLVSMSPNRRSAQLKSHVFTRQGFLEQATNLQKMSQCESFYQSQIN